MRNSTNLVIAMVREVSVLDYIALGIGTPSMITFIVSLWGTLSQTQQVIAIVCMSLVLLAIVLFIYSRVSRTLFVIPRILKKRHSIISDTAGKLNYNAGSDDMKEIINFVGIDLELLLENMIDDNDIDNLNPIINQSKNTADINSQEDKELSHIIINYMSEKSKLKEALNSNSKYQKLTQKLEKIKENKIPTKEILEAVNKYEFDSYALNSKKSFIDNSIVNNLPLKERLRSQINEDKINKEMTKDLIAVRESIINYYRR